MRIAIVIFVLLLAYAAVFIVSGLRTAHVAGRAFAKVKRPEERGIILEAIREHRAKDDLTTVFINIGIEFAACLLIGVLIEALNA